MKTSLNSKRYIGFPIKCCSPIKKKPNHFVLVRWLISHRQILTLAIHDKNFTNNIDPHHHHRCEKAIINTCAPKKCVSTTPRATAVSVTSSRTLSTHEQVVTAFSCCATPWIVSRSILFLVFFLHSLPLFWRDDVDKWLFYGSRGLRCAFRPPPPLHLMLDFHREKFFFSAMHLKQ